MADWGGKLATAAVGEWNGVSISIYREFWLCVHAHTLYIKPACLVWFFWRIFKYSQKVPVG